MLLCSRRGCDEAAMYEVSAKGTGFGHSVCQGSLCIGQAKREIEQDFPGRGVVVNPLRK